MMGPFAYLSKVLAEIERKRVLKLEIIQILNFIQGIKTIDNKT